MKTNTHTPQKKNAVGLDKIFKGFLREWDYGLKGGESRKVVPFPKETELSGGETSWTDATSWQCQTLTVANTAMDSSSPHEGPMGGPTAGPGRAPPPRISQLAPTFLQRFQVLQEKELQPHEEYC